MAYLVTHFWPGATMEQYDQTVGVLQPAEWPSRRRDLARRRRGRGGVLIAAVWRSKEHFDRFLSDRVTPSMPIANGLSGQPQQQAADIANLVAT
jgi:hypothetical protein